MALLSPLVVALCGSLSAQSAEETVRLLAPSNSHSKADTAAELAKRHEGLHDHSDFPYYGYGHKRLPKEKLSYNMTEAEAETLLRKDLMVRCKLFHRYKEGALLLAVLGYNAGQGILLGHGEHLKSKLIRRLEAGDGDIYREYVTYCRYRGKTVRSIERRCKVEFLLLYER